MNSENKSTFNMPAPGALPGSDADLRDIGRFIYYHDPTAHFQKLWGPNYTENVRSLWEQLNNAFKEGEKAAVQAEELLMGMAYDWTLGPYLGVPESQKRAFLKWLLEGIRDRLQSQS
jgi:hypothetical protein